MGVESTSSIEARIRMYTGRRLGIHRRLLILYETRARVGGHGHTSEAVKHGQVTGREQRKQE